MRLLENSAHAITFDKIMEDIRRTGRVHNRLTGGQRGDMRAAAAANAVEEEELVPCCQTDMLGT